MIVCRRPPQHHRVLLDLLRIIHLIQDHQALPEVNHHKAHQDHLDLQALLDLPAILDHRDKMDTQDLQVLRVFQDRQDQQDYLDHQVLQARSLQDRQDHRDLLDHQDHQDYLLQVIRCHISGHRHLQAFLPVPDMGNRLNRLNHRVFSTFQAQRHHGVSGSAVSSRHHHKR